MGVLIETERLLLRPLTMTDVDDLVALQARPEVSRFMFVFTREQAVARVEQDERDWRERGHGLMAIVDGASGRFLGRTGLRYWPQFGETEVGWVLWPDVWGRGFATEAARATVDWGFGRFAFPYLTAMIRADNVRSIRVAERLGMTPLRSDVLLDLPVVVHGLDRGTWSSPPA